MLWSSARSREASGDIDGSKNNTALLDSILRSRYELKKSTFIATSDIAKAFPSVKHSSILECSRAAVLPPSMIRYPEHYYSNGTTTLNVSDWVSPPILPTRGVKQGDPLSSVLFNLVIDHLLRSLLRECGLRFGDGIIRAMAFADMNLIAETPQGLQALIDHSTAYLLQ